MKGCCLAFALSAWKRGRSGGNLKATAAWLSPFPKRRYEESVASTRDAEDNDAQCFANFGDKQTVKNVWKP
jgi:hypothetical protein